MLENITIEDLEFMETLCHPDAFAETAFSDMDNMQVYDKNNFSHIRTGQLPMLSFEYLIDDEDKNLNKKENFRRLEGAGNLYNFGARRFGKSCISLIIDILEAVFHLDGWRTLYSSYDALHILQIMERVIPPLEKHPLYQLFGIKIKRSPNYVITTTTGFELQSVNMNITSKAAGSNFFGHHVKKLWIDEFCLDGKTKIKIKTPEGNIKTETLVGFVKKDLQKTCTVLSYNLAEKKPEFKKVSNTFKKLIKKGFRYKLILNNSKQPLICSENERIHTQTGYKCVQDITLKDKVFKVQKSTLTEFEYNLQPVDILKIEKEKTRYWTMYDLEVEDNNNFFANNILVHNSKCTPIVEEKLIDAVSELGCISRFCGMTDFTRHSPAGKVFERPENKKWICNFPQYISPMWDEGERIKQERRYGGEKTVSFRVFVVGEICEDGISVFDMDRVRLNYDEKKKIKNFEINKDNYKSFKHILIIERPGNAELCIVGADIGETAPTEIVITFKINGKHHYTYNITLYNLTDKEQYKIFKYIMIMLNPEMAGLDCGDGTGRSIYRRLEEDFTNTKLFYYDGSKKFAIGYKKDDDGRVIMVNGKPEVMEEYMSEYSVKHLKNLLYDELMLIPQDFKFDTQINSVISLQSHNRVIYECVSVMNHLFDAFKVWSLSQWTISFSEQQVIKRKPFSKAGC